MSIQIDAVSILQRLKLAIAYVVQSAASSSSKASNEPAVDDLCNEMPRDSDEIFVRGTAIGGIAHDQDCSRS
jgi:hypothetical protein